MERENFYLLLELSLDPPEESAKTIEKAIASLRAKWSRFHNHPTKSVQAKKVMGMIPEMRRVMLDPELRREEARRGRKELKRQLESKYSEVDRHIAIRMSKGFMTDEEIFKLAKLHAMAEADIRGRIRQKQQQQYAEIDKSIAIRMSKGYVTEDEVIKIAKLHAVGLEEVRQRIQGPIRKTGPRSIDQLKTLDKTIESVISSNLKIVGKTSLYDFLGLPPGSELELLQQRASEKEAQIHKTSATDAMATASGILAGHCITLFKDDNSRRVYDATLAQSHLKELNSDIDVAGMDGKLRAEYLGVLVDRAVQFGMDDQEALTYIERYCRRKHWTIEKKKKRRFPLLLVAAICLLIAAGGFYAFKIMQQKDFEKAYQNVRAQVDRESNLNKKKQLLQSFIATHKTEDVAEKARRKIKTVQKQILEQEYLEMRRKAEALIKEGRLDEAEKIYRRYLSAHPDRQYEGSIKKQLAELARLGDENAFATIKSANATDVYDQVNRCQQFIAVHPNSSHLNDVKEMIAAAREAYYVRLLRDCQAADGIESLKTALAHLTTFLAIYGEDDPRIINLKDLQSTLESRLQDQQAFAALKAEAQKDGSDVDAARQAYRDYLLSYPDSTVKEQIQAELQRIEDQQRKNRIAHLRKLSAGRLESSANRFKTVREEGMVVQDQKSGLMWALLDASDVLGEKEDCLDYKAALGYVKSMNLAGFRDWRLPTPDELWKLYTAAFPLPLQETRWYWTSKSYTRYTDVDGWSKVVDVVASQPRDPRKKQLDSRECVSVRAVRP